MNELGLTREELEALGVETNQEKKGSLGWRAKKLLWGLTEVAVAPFTGLFGPIVAGHGAINVGRAITAI